MKLPSKKTGRPMRLVAGALAVSGVAGCFTLGVGLPPPTTELYYPTALLTSPGQHALYVVNSDFDIQYTGGTVQAINLDGVRTCVARLAFDLNRVEDDDLKRPPMAAPKACEDVGLSWKDDRSNTGDTTKNAADSSVIVPGPCTAVDLESPVPCSLANIDSTAEDESLAVAGPLLETARVIGAFASSATLVHNPDPQSGDALQRLFVAVRGDPSVTYFDTTADPPIDGTIPAKDTSHEYFRLDCRQDGTSDTDGTCPQGSRIGASPYQSFRLLTMPVEPTSVAASDDGEAIVVVHQTGGTNSATHGQASLVVNTWGSTPALEFTLAGLPDFPSDITAIPTAKFVAKKKGTKEALDYRPGFLVSFRAAPEIDLLRYFDDSAGTSRSFLQRVGAFTIATNSDGSDSRGIAINAAERKACEALCDEDDLDCLQACVDIPLQVFIANRTPASLLIGRLETHLTMAGSAVSSIDETLNINDMVPLATGPSRVVVGDVIDSEGKPSPRVFVISFDSRYVVIYDPEQRRVEAAVRTGRGPHAMAFDMFLPPDTDAAKKTDRGLRKGSAFLYVAHFTDSYIGVIDLDTRHSSTYGSMIATVGVPNPPKESQ